MAEPPSPWTPQELQKAQQPHPHHQQYKNTYTIFTEQQVYIYEVKPLRFGGLAVIKLVHTSIAKWDVVVYI